jgi:membrane-bound serine protease (ClpP class)
MIHSPLLVPTRRLLAAALLAALPAFPARADIPVVDLDGIVQPISARHVVAAIEAADAAGAPLLILRLDTPGGLDVSMREIVDKMLNCRTPVAVFVGPSGARAASAGFVITIASDVAAMAPGTNIGAAHPVAGIGEMDEVMSKKVASDAAAYIRSKAAQRGRNVEMAEKAVLESRSFTEREAVDLKLVDLVAKDPADLVRMLEGREVTRFDGSKVTLRLTGQPLTAVRMDWRQGILSAIASPQTLFLLLLGTLAGLGAEISHPGAIFPGVVGSLCLVLFLFASQVIPVNWAGVLLVVLAVFLFAAEVKVASHGLLTVGGITAMILGAMMLVDAPAPGMQVPLRFLLPAAVVMAAGTILLARLVVAARRRRPVTGSEGLIGRTATADTDLRPEGWVLVMGERWRGVADGDVASGERVTVVGMDGLTLRVKKGA